MMSSNSCVIGRSWKRTKTRSSIDDVGLTGGWGMWQGPRRIMRRVSRRDHTPRREYPGTWFYLRLDTCLNPPKKFTSYAGWQFSSNVSLGFIPLITHCSFRNRKCSAKIMSLIPRDSFLTGLWRLHFLGLWNGSLKRHQEARECTRRLIQRLCQACERNDTQTVVPFELWRTNRIWLSDSLAPLHYTHHPYTPANPRDFRVSTPYTHRPPQLSDFFPYAPTSYK